MPSTGSYPSPARRQVLNTQVSRARPSIILVDTLLAAAKSLANAATLSLERSWLVKSNIKSCASSSSFPGESCSSTLAGVAVAAAHDAAKLDYTIGQAELPGVSAALAVAAATTALQEALAVELLATVELLRSQEVSWSTCSPTWHTVAGYIGLY